MCLYTTSNRQSSVTLSSASKWCSDHSRKAKYSSWSAISWHGVAQDVRLRRILHLLKRNLPKTQRSLLKMQIRTVLLSHKGDRVPILRRLVMISQKTLSKRNRLSIHSGKTMTTWTGCLLLLTAISKISRTKCWQLRKKMWRYLSSVLELYMAAGSNCSTLCLRLLGCKNQLSCRISEQAPTAFPLSIFATLFDLSLGLLKIPQKAYLISWHSIRPMTSHKKLWYRQSQQVSAQARLVPRNLLR